MRGYAAAYLHSFGALSSVERLVDKTQILNIDFNWDQKLPDDGQLMIETCWSDFKCFNV
jgi:hypothetical protein